MIKRVALIVVVTIASGCSTYQEKAAPEFAKGIDTYCDNVPYVARIENRGIVNSLTKPGNECTCKCAGDPIEESVNPAE